MQNGWIVHCALQHLLNMLQVGSPSHLVSVHLGRIEDKSWTAAAGYSPFLLPPGSSPIKTVKIQVITKLGEAWDDGENGPKMTNGPNSLNQSSLYNARVELSLTREKRCN